MNKSVHRKRDYRIGKRPEDFALRDPPCAHCLDPVMSRRRDGRGRPAHLVCRIRVRRRAEADR